MNLKGNKAVMALICALGIAGVIYGMVRENHGVFIVGLALLVAGYLIIRKELKRASKEL